MILDAQLSIEWRVVRDKWSTTLRIINWTGEWTQHSLIVHFMAPLLHLPSPADPWTRALQLCSLARWHRPGSTADWMSPVLWIQVHWPLDEDQRVWYSQGEPLLTAGSLVVVGGERSSSTRRSFRIDTCPRIRCQKVLSRMSRTLEGIWGKQRDVDWNLKVILQKLILFNWTWIKLI